MVWNSSPFVLLVLLAACIQLAATQQDAGSRMHPFGHKESLKTCFERAGVHAVTGADPDYDKARRTLSKFSNNYPVAVAYPITTEQVQAAVKCAKAARVKVLPRCGGHGNEGESVETGAVTLDMQHMNRVSVADDHNTAWAEGGANMGQLLAEVIRVSNNTRGFPAGVRPTVGVAGFILGGGFGGFTRYAGLGADNLIAIKGVDANGNVVVADKDTNPELLWASRGAGGGKFVIVTDFHVRLMDVTPGVTNYFTYVPLEQAIDAMMFYQQWAPTLPAIMTPRAAVRKDPVTKKATFQIGGRYMGSIEDTKKALIASGMHDSKVLHVDMFTYKNSDYFTAVEDSVGFPLPPGPDKLTVLSGRKYWEFEYAWAYKFRSLIVDTPFPREFFETALEFGQYPGTEVEFQTLTGSVSTVPKDATAVGHLRTGNFVLAVRGTKEPSDNKVSSEWGERLPPSVCPMAPVDEVMQGNANASSYIQKFAAFVPEVKSYINFRDTDMPAWAPDYLAAYYGDQLPALECVKLKYDPANLFSLPMDIRAPTGSADHCTALLKRVGSAAADYSEYLLTAGPARSAPPTFTEAPTEAVAALGRKLASHMP